MLYIKPFTSEDGLPQFAEAFREGRLSYIAFSGKEIIGHIFYRARPDRLFIEEVESGGDLGLFDGLIRAVADAAVTAGLPCAEFGPKVDKASLSALSVPVDGQNCLGSLPAFLHNCKSCNFS